MIQKMNAINRFLKIFKTFILKCPKCGLVKKSALGHLSHIEVIYILVIDSCTIPGSNISILTKKNEMHLGMRSERGGTRKRQGTM